MTTPALLRIDTGDPTPPYEQLRRQFADLIHSGVLVTGQRLPPLRQLAADLGLAVGTVARTYRELEAAGLVASRRGGGTRVRATAPPLPNAAHQDRLRQHAREFVRQARLLGAGDDDVRSAVEAALGPAHVTTTGPGTAVGSDTGSQPGSTTRSGAAALPGR